MVKKMAQDIVVWSSLFFIITIGFAQARTAMILYIDDAIYRP